MKTIYSPALRLAGLISLSFLLASVASAQSLTILNAASFSGTSVAPGSIITIFGTNLATGTASVRDPANPPTTLGGSQVTVGGAPASLFYVSSTQINAVVASATPVGTQAVVVTTASGASTSGSVLVSTTPAPGIFSLSGTGSHDGAIVDALTGRIGAVKATTPVSTTFLALFTTGANFSTPPIVTIAGISVPVTYAGPSPCCRGLQQINISIPATLAGSGRVPLTIRAAGQLSNVVEIVMLPQKGEGAFENEKDSSDRSRELSAIAYIPTTNLALVTDENGDVVRVVDVLQRKVVRVIALPSNSEPVMVALNATGTLAVVAQRGRGKIAIIDLVTWAVVSEITVGAGPLSVAVSGNLAVVVNGNANSVTIVNLTTGLAVATVPVGAGPRAVAIGSANLAYITNQSDGTISVLNLATATVTSTITLSGARPAAIRLIAGTPYAIVTDPATSDDGKVLVVHLTTGAVTSFNVNPDRSGGSSDVVVVGSTAYIANQSGGSISILPLSISGATVTGVATTLKVGSGVRALAVDTRNNLLLVLSQGKGEIVLVSLASGQVVGRLSGVRTRDDDDDDHSDYDKAANLPTVSAVLPLNARAATTFTITLTGTNLFGAADVIFARPSAFPGKSQDHGKGRGLIKIARDSAFTVTNIQVNTAATQLTATVNTSAQAVIGTRVVIVSTSNGESSFIQAATNTFTVIP